MPTNKSSKATLNPANRASTSKSPPQPVASNSVPKRTLLPRAKYFSVVPLHLIFTIFAIHFLPSRRRQNWEWDVGPLVENPYRSLVSTNLALVCVQVWFASSLRTWRRIGTGIAGGERRAHNNKLELVQKVLADASARKFDPAARKALLELIIPIQDALIITGISSLFIHTLMVLIGAPVFVDGLKTFLLALLVAILAVLPSALVIGWNQGREKMTWVRIFSEFDPKNALEVVLMWPAVGTCIGTWMGGIPIPLDWDRPWQKWPVTCVLGASIGHLFGTVIAMILVGLHKHPT